MWPDARQTQSLLEEARRGSTNALNDLLGMHRDALRHAVNLRLDPCVRQRIDASDIVQEVLIEASRRLPDYLGRASMPFSLWLRQLAQDRIIDAHRRHRGAQRRSLDRERSLGCHRAGESSFDLANVLRDREHTPASAAMWRELELRFQEAVENLDPADREIILLRHFEQLSNQEAAGELGLSEAAAGMRHLRALRRLRAILAHDGSQEGGVP